MISLRHYLLTLVAVFLALAVGVVLGGGPLADVGDKVVAATNQPAGDDGDGSAAGAFSDGFAGAVAPELVTGRLADTSVAVITLPGADEQVVTGLADLVGQAGGSISGHYVATEELVDPGQKSLVDTLGSQLLTQEADGQVPAEATTYDRFGHLLGSAVATTEGTAKRVHGGARAVTDAMTGADLLGPVEGAEQRAPVILLVLGTDAGDEQHDAILAGLVAGLGAQSAGLVIAGTVDDGGEGQLGRLRADPAVGTAATVDGIDTAAGRVAAVRALARSLSTDGGSFGASGADGTVPLG